MVDGMKNNEYKSKIFHTVTDNGKFNGEYQNEQYIDRLYADGCIDAIDRRELEIYNRMLCR